MSVARGDLTRLHYINALFAQVTGSDLYLAEQIKSAIAFSLGELEEQCREHPEFAARFDAAFNSAAANLLTRLFDRLPSHGFHHWDAAQSSTSATPLFTREAIMAGLKKLARFREATLLVTNLRPALVPASRRASPKRVREYEEALAFIRDLAASRTSAASQLHLIFL